LRSKPVTAWSGLFDGVYGSPYALQFPKNLPLRGVIAQLLLHRGMRRDASVIMSLLGAAPGATATSSYTRVKAPNTGASDIMKNGGKVPTETFVEINRATTAADVTELKTYLFDKNHNIAVARDKGGNSIKGNAGVF
jgi:hypothetical protein